MSKYIVHKAVTLDKVKAKRKAVISRPYYLEENFIAQPKYDGCNLLVTVYQLPDGAWAGHGNTRTGEEVKSIDHIVAALTSLPGIVEGVYLGECWAPDLDFATISGIMRRQYFNEESCRLQFAIFDYITLEEFDLGISDLVYTERVERIPELLGSVPQGKAPVWLAGSFGRIGETWPGTTAQDVCNKLVAAGGYDGLILRDPDGTWIKGDNGGGGEIIKLKRVLSFDLRVIGFEPGKGKHAGKIGSLIVSYNDKPMGAGTGLKDSERSVENFERDWLGKIVEVEAMDFSSDGLLREPRMKGIRTDKLEPDA